MMIELQDVSVMFKIPHQKKTTLFETISGLLTLKRYTYTEFLALRNVTLSVSKGQTLGIIGENGSGKSTLLKLIAGIIKQDRGTISVVGKVTPFIELGAGFEPELTVKDNIFLYGAIMGMKRKELEKQLPSIFEFSELQEFQDSKLRTLSSGMVMRLAFSTAINVNPDILLIDEVFAVGDESFQKKCFEKFEEFKRMEKTILFVSHTLPVIQKMCEKSILLHKGEIVMRGESEKVINYYLKLLDKK
jgi:lipopolysaccharide transport system ATP-binding protein